MKIAVVKPISHLLQHRVRGTGLYIENLEKSLKQYDKKNSYVFCSVNEIPKDVDLVHYPYFEPFFITLPLLKKNKTVVTVHDLTPLVFPKNFPRGIKGELKWQIQKILLKNIDMITTDSNSSKKDILKFTNISDKKIKVVYLAASPNFKKKSVTDSKHKLPIKFVLYVGDATWNKNLPRLIQAVKNANLPLVLVGKIFETESSDNKNPWNKDLSTVFQLIKGDKNIIRLGFVSDEELVNIYNKATLLLMPSLYEGFGLTILEAMSCGCAVITSKEGSIPEVAGDAAFYINPCDINGISQAVKKVFFNNYIQKELSEKGLRQAKQFSWKKTSEEMIKIYESLSER